MASFRTSRSTTTLATTLATVSLLGAGLIGPATAAPAGDTSLERPRTTLTSRCIDSRVRLSVEEGRLNSKLPDNQNPAVLQRLPFAQQMIDGAGFQWFGPALVKELCRTRDPRAARDLVERRGERLWRMAVDRAQHKRGRVAGRLPYSDDRPLYWTRLQATAALRQWEPRFRLSVDERDALITAFDKASRGMFDIRFPAGPRVKRVILSGFDPYTLDGGDQGTAQGAVGNNIRHGNPSGAIALALDGTTYTARNGTRQVIAAYTLPVNYTEFAAGYLEDTVGPWMRRGRRQVDASITVSQYGGSEFKLEQWNARYHGVSPGNDNSQPCRSVGGVPQLAVNNQGCNTQVVHRWGGPVGFDLFDPPQWTTASLPVDAMIRADTGRSVPRPPGDTWPDPTRAFGVIWHTNYTEFPDCASTTLLTRNDPPPATYPPSTPPVPPDPTSCSYSGGGGNYLSNESAYRNTLLRDRLGRDIPAGHIHTPGMQNFDQGNLYNPTDATFDAWRRAIVAQARNLVHVVGASS
jgi:hypothetical protein